MTNIHVFYSRLQDIEDREKIEFPGKFIPELRLIYTDMGGQTKVWIITRTLDIYVSSPLYLGVVSSIPV